MSLCLYPPISNMVVYLITCFCFRVPLIRLWFEITAPSAEADHWWEKFFEVKGSSEEIFHTAELFVYIVLQIGNCLLFYKGFLKLIFLN